MNKKGISKERKNYDIIVEERKKILSSKDNIVKTLKDFSEHMNNYYEKIRWEKCECTDEEYAAVFDLVTFIENNDLLDTLEIVINKLEK